MIAVHFKRKWKIYDRYQITKKLIVYKIHTFNKIIQIIKAGHSELRSGLKYHRIVYSGGSQGTFIR